MSPEQAGAAAADYGAGMIELGVNMVLAPVVDIGSGPGIGSRSYSDSPEVVTEYAAAVVDGYLAAGVIPVLKHFPGMVGPAAILTMACRQHHRSRISSSST